MIFQEPMTALNPLSPVGRQIAEMFVLHKGKSWSEAQARAVEALANVRVPAPERRVKDYPHQLSGGMRQRVMIAIALACGPDLLIADEPTTALDVTVQAEIIELMQELCAAQGTAILMISHDLGLVANSLPPRRGDVCRPHRRGAVAPATFSPPRRIPIRAAWSARCRGSASRAAHGRQKLQEITGVVPAIAHYPAGCRFQSALRRA